MSGPCFSPRPTMNEVCMRCGQVWGKHDALPPHGMAGCCDTFVRPIPVADPVPAPTVDLDAIRARVVVATNGPWEFAENPHEALVLAGRDANGDVRVVAYTYGEPLAVADAQFIAAARTDVPALLAELSVLRAREAQVRELHRKVVTHRDYSGRMVCSTCDKPWPCPTVAVLDGTTGDGTR